MSSFDSLYKQAVLFLREGNTEDARKSLVEAEKKYIEPNEKDEISQEDIFVLKASIEYASNNMAAAEKYFEQALHINKNSIEACLGLGKVYFSSQMLGQSKTMYEWAVKLSPENNFAIEQLKLVNEKLGYDVDHISENSTQEDRLNLSEYFDEAYELFMDDEFEKTLKTIDNIEKVYTKEINLLKGNTYLAMNILDKAKKAFEKILEVDPKSGEACNGLAEMFLMQGKKEDAKTMFECALEYNPSDQFALLGLSEINHELGLSPTHSLTNFFSKKNISEKTSQVIDEAYNLFNEKKFTESIKIIEDLEKSQDYKNENHESGMHASLNNFKGFNYLAIDNLEKAKSLFEGSLKLNPNSSQACAGLGEILYLNGDDENAKTMFEWAVKNNNKNEYAKKGLNKVNLNLGLPGDDNTLDLGIDDEVHKEFNAEISEAYNLFDKKMFSEAVNKLNKVEKLIDHDTLQPSTKKTLASVLNFKGFCCLALSDNDEARKAFEKSLQFNPNSSQACAGLGEILYLEGDDGKAKKMFEWALRNEANNMFAKSGLKKVNAALNLKDEDNTLVKGNLTGISGEIDSLIATGYSLYSAKKYIESLEKLDAAESLIVQHYSDEESGTTLSSLNNFKGFNYLGLDKNSKAKACFEKSLKFNSESSQACAGLGEVLFIENNDKAAKEMFEWAVKYNHDNLFAIAGLEKVNKALGLEALHNSQLEETV
ncbi:MAG: tetratricopeptide repeat protein [Melioribacteraceae bacterium]|nr:tetratricopeptide repeat protein [Melioribacteraceae bacterium]